jgi:hypothetical protein
MDMFLAVDWSCNVAVGSAKVVDAEWVVIPPPSILYVNLFISIEFMNL